MVSSLVNLAPCPKEVSCGKQKAFRINTHCRPDTRSLQQSQGFLTSMITSFSTVSTPASSFMYWAAGLRCDQHHSVSKQGPNKHGTQWYQRPATCTEQQAMLAYQQGNGLGDREGELIAQAFDEGQNRVILQTKYTHTHTHTHKQTNI